MLSALRCARQCDASDWEAYFGIADTYRTGLGRDRDVADARRQGGKVMSFLTPNAVVVRGRSMIRRERQGLPSGGRLRSSQRVF